MANDLTSPGAAFARQARTEGRIAAIMARAMRGFLSDVRELTELHGINISAGQIVASWQGRVSAALLSHPIADHARDYIAEVFGESVVPDQAFEVARTLMTIALDEGWTQAEVREALGEVFAFDESLTASGGDAVKRRRRQAEQVAARSATARTRRAAEEKAAKEAEAAQSRAARTPVGGIRKGRSGGRGPRHGALWDQLDASGLNWAAKMRRDARTAVTGLDGMNTARELADQGFTRRRWVTMHDDAVRDTHRAADGQTVGLDEPFVVGGASLRWPGDRLGPAGEVINCRCITVGVRWRAR